jgi:hypothetical protein
MSISPYFRMTGSEARGLLYGLMESDKIQLRDNPSLPSVRKLIDDGKIKYRRADEEEHWQTYREMVEAVQNDGIAYADCEDLACAIAAEDQVRYGVLSLPYAYSPRQGLFHVVVAVPEGQYGALPGRSWPGAQGADPIPGYIFQDPSVVAGMTSFGGISVPGAVKKAGRGIGSFLSSFTKSVADAAGVSDPESLARSAGELAASEVKLLTDAVPALALMDDFDSDMADEELEDPDEDILDEELDLELEEDLAFDDEIDLDDEFDLEEEFGFDINEPVGTPSWSSDVVANRVQDDLLGGFGGIYPMGIFRDHVDGPDIDLHEDLGPRSLNAPQPRITYGDLGCSPPKAEEAYGNFLSSLLQGEFMSASGLTRRLERQIDKAEEAMDAGDEARTLRFARKVLSTSSSLEKKGENPRARQDVSALISFVRHKDLEKLDDELSSGPSPSDSKSSKKKSGRRFNRIDKSNIGRSKKSAMKESASLESILSELEREDFGSIPIQLRGRYELAPVVAPGIDTGTVVPVPIRPRPFFGPEVEEGIHEGFEDFLAESRRW